MTAGASTKLARAGKITEFTGISGPCDVPETPELRVETETVDVGKRTHRARLPPGPIFGNTLTL